MLTPDSISNTGTAAVRDGVFVHCEGGVSGGTVSPAPFALKKMRVRKDFLAANNGMRIAMPGFILLVRKQACEAGTVRMGITVTKRIGNAVVRNLMKRRFRDLMRQKLPALGIEGADHVLIGREKGIERDFAQLSNELEQALQRIHDGKSDAKPNFRKGPRGPRKGVK